MAFADFPEQKQVVELLQRSLERHRLAHAYLFSGTDIVELESVARTLAKVVNCESPKRGEGNAAIDSCDKCSTCRRIDEENHPDTAWIRPESKSRIIEVEQIRDLIQNVNLKPTSAEFKIGVITSADRLTSKSGNAFLKTLEEPPARSILILLSTEPQRLLETILSRCLRLNFSGERKLREAEFAWLSSFAEMALDAKGGLLGRYRLLGVLAHQLSELKENIKTALEAKSPLARYNDLDANLREKYENELDAAAEAEYRRQRTDLLLALQLWLRDVWLRTLVGADELLSLSQLAAATQAVAQRLSSAEAMANLQVLEETQRLLGTNIQEALALEIGFLKLKL